MAKRRHILPDFFEDEKVGGLPPDVRLLYISLWVLADDKGRGKGGPPVFKSWCFLYDDKTGLKRVQEMVDLLEREGRILTYEHNGESYFVVPRLPGHQWITNASVSKMPKPPKERLEKLVEPVVVKELLDDRPWKKQNGVAVDPDEEVETKSSDVQVLFEYWKKVNQMKRGVLNDKRRGHITARLKEGYSVEDLKRAIVGNRVSEWHQENGHRDIGLVCRNAEKTDNFLRIYNKWEDDTGGWDEEVLFTVPEKHMFEPKKKEDEQDLFDQID